ncbi:unnamed protein product, partial [Polarella glacialis]
IVPNECHGDFALKSRELPRHSTPLSGDARSAPEYVEYMVPAPEYVEYVEPNPGMGLVVTKAPRTPAQQANISPDWFPADRNVTFSAEKPELKLFERAGTAKKGPRDDGILWNLLPGT